MNPACSICRDPALRNVVDGALLAGMRPAETFHTFVEPGDHASLSSVYRHARGHVSSPLLPNYLGDSSSGEVIADLAAVARSAYTQHKIAIEKGQHAAAARWAHESVQAFSALQRAGIENEDQAIDKRSVDAYINLISRYMFLHRESMPEFSRIATGYGYHDIADDIDGDLAEAFAAHDAALVVA